MTVLEIIAEQRFGIKNLTNRPKLRAALQRIDESAGRAEAGGDEKASVASLVELCFAYERETDLEEKANILRTLEEISENETLELLRSKKFFRLPLNPRKRQNSIPDFRTQRTHALM